MTAFSRSFKFSVIALVGATLYAHAAQAPQRIDVKQMSKRVENVVVPLPNEIFGALNKLGSVNWRVIADGFIAVQAEDAPAVKEIGQRVLNLSKGIGVGNSITPHAKAITDAADKRKWENVRQELDRTQSSVQAAMNEVHDEKLSQLVSLGGWLRGTQVLTSVVTKHFSPDGAELLHQPDLLVHFQAQLQAMPEFNLPIIREIQNALVEVRPLVDVGSSHISPDSVRKISEITNRLDSGIVTRD